MAKVEIGILDRHNCRTHFCYSRWSGHFYLQDRLQCAISPQTGVEGHSYL